MATRTFTITQSGATRTFTVSSGVGATGAAGATGATGATGSTGPNAISAATTTAFGGILAGDGANVQLATTAQKVALPISTATQTALDAKETSGAAATVQGNLDTHEADTANPHTVTKAQVGLGSADNTSDASKPVSTAQASADAVVLAAAVQRSNHTGTQTLATISDAGTAAANDTTDFPLTDPSGVTGADAVTNIISLTQAEYNAIGTPGASTLYILTD